MLDKTIQYVNIIKTGKNIKIENQILQKDAIIKQENSIFLLQENNISNDAILKLQTL